MVPFAQRAHVLATGVQVWQSKPLEVMTKDKRILRIRSCGRWRISNPLAFHAYVRPDGGRVMPRALDDALNSAVVDVLQRHSTETLMPALSGTAECDAGNATTLPSSQPSATKPPGTGAIAKEVLEQSAERTRLFGVSLMEIQIARTRRPRQGAEAEPSSRAAGAPSGSASDQDERRHREAADGTGNPSPTPRGPLSSQECHRYIVHLTELVIETGWQPSEDKREAYERTIRANMEANLQVEVERCVQEVSRAHYACAMNTNHIVRIDRCPPRK